MPRDDGTMAFSWDEELGPPPHSTSHVPRIAQHSRTRRVLRRSFDEGSSFQIPASTPTERTALLYEPPSTISVTPQIAALHITESDVPRLQDVQNGNVVPEVRDVEIGKQSLRRKSSATSTRSEKPIGGKSTFGQTVSTICGRCIKTTHGWKAI